MKKIKNKYVCFVKGVHCSSCSVVIERKLKETKGVFSVELNEGENKISIEHSPETVVNSAKLNEMFENENYIFSEKPIRVPGRKKYRIFALLAGLAVAALFLIGKNNGLVGNVEIDSNSSLSMFFLFGLVAGISGCATLVGSIILAMSKKWSSYSSPQNTFRERFFPYFSFNLGRIFAYSLSGGLLGLAGKGISLSPRFGAFMVIVVSLLMLLAALQMFEIPQLKRFRFKVPEFLRNFLTSQKASRGALAPFLIGAGTLFLPCGFTLTAQGLALISASAVKGFLITTLFALGTLPSLLAISAGAIKFMNKPKYAQGFMQFTAVILIFFALYNVNAQLNVLGLPSFGDVSLPSGTTKEENKNINSSSVREDGLPPVVEGKQVVKMEATGHDYRPKKFKVKAGIPIKWEIFDRGADGCTNAIIAEDLFDGEIKLKKGQTSVKEFTVQKPGRYKFSCWMGMVYGSFEVVK